MSGKKRRRKKVADTTDHEVLEQDENFYFIAGYTEGGFPFGITWEEHEAEKNGSDNDVVFPNENAL